jgi:hypothetical protein
MDALPLLAVALASALPTAAGVNACDGASACTTGTCRAISMGTTADCSASSASCVTGLCLLQQPAGEPSAAVPVSVVAIQGATRSVGSSSAATWQPRTMPVTLRTFVSGCNSSSGAHLSEEGAPSVATGRRPSSRMTTASYTLQCAGGSTLHVQETFGVGGNGSALWETTLSSIDSALWSAYLGHDYWYGFNSSSPPDGWFPGAGGKKFYPRAGYSPFSPWSLADGPPGGTKVGYGSESGEVVTVLGMGSALFPEQDTALSFVQNPAAFPYLAGLDLCGKQSGGKSDQKCPTGPLPSNDSRSDQSLFFSWGATGYRLGGSTSPVQLSQNLLVTNADWRAPYGWAVDHLPEFFEPHVDMSAVDGPGSYAHLGHPVIDNETGAQVAWDTGYNYTDGLDGNPPPLEAYMDLGNTFNWDATFPYQSHGNFIPYNLTSGEPFGDCARRRKSSPLFQSSD